MPEPPIVLSVLFSIPVLAQLLREVLEASLALRQSTSGVFLTLLSGRVQQQARHPHCIVPSLHSRGCYQLTVRFRFVSTHFDSSSPLHTTPRLLALDRKSTRLNSSHVR